MLCQDLSGDAGTVSNVTFPDILQSENISNGSVSSKTTRIVALLITDPTLSNVEGTEWSSVMEVYVEYTIHTK